MDIRSIYLFFLFSFMPREVLLRWLAVCSECYCFCWWKLGLGLGTRLAREVQGHEESRLKDRVWGQGQRIVSLHTLTRLWGRWWACWLGLVAGADWPVTRCGRRRDGELSAPQLCRCRSSCACFLGLLMIRCDCDITCAESFKNDSLDTVSQSSASYCSDPEPAEHPTKPICRTWEHFMWSKEAITVSHSGAPPLITDRWRASS